MGSKQESMGNADFMACGRGWNSDNRTAKKLCKDARNTRSRRLGQRAAKEVKV